MVAALTLSFLPVVLGTTNIACTKPSPVERDSHAERDSPGGWSASPSREAHDTVSGAIARAKARSALEKKVAELRSEAGLEEPSGVSPPAGDLKAEIEAFSSLDECVRARAVQDPLLADSIHALGYDTLVRDACRTLQALKSKALAPCSAILSSALRNRCEADVAIAAAKPEWCPVVRSGGGIDGHEPDCLARATGDARLCDAVSGGGQPSCRALAKAESAACGSDVVCQRQVARWRGVLRERGSTPSVGRPSPNESRDLRVQVTLTPIRPLPHPESASNEYSAVRVPSVAEADVPKPGAAPSAAVAPVAAGSAVARVAPVAAGSAVARVAPVAAGSAVARVAPVAAGSAVAPALAMHATTVDGGTRLAVTPRDGAIIDLGDVAKAGVVLRKIDRHTELIIGAPLAAGYWDTHHTTPKLFMRAVLQAGDVSRMLARTKASRVELDLLVPGLGRLSAISPAGFEVVTATVGATIGSPATLVVTSELHEAGRVFYAEIAIDSYVRDIMDRSDH